ncbi:MAG: sigma 54-interacting transcriptional regulator [Candidatus Thiodiazotropha sp.]
MDPKRISLAEASRVTGRMLSADEARQFDETPPTLRDLAEHLFFSPGDGRIWLNDKRMVLMHSSTLGVLRKELVTLLGIEPARALLTRAGYVSGMRDAEMVREQYAGADLVSTLLAGTRLHALEGMVKVEPLHLDFDLDKGEYTGEFLWHHSCEVEEHVAAFGMGTETACWGLTGYAIGYVTTLLGKLIIFRETECRAAGCNCCRVIGKPAEDWPDVERDLRYIHAEGFVSTDAYSPPAGNHMEEAMVLPDTPFPDAASNHMVGVSAAFNAACHMLQRVAPTRATVLFTGESGVGKELFASMLHNISPRKDEPFISINCAAIPETLVEAELFGVERGAFTGAIASRPGRFERANGGTLFLDEIGTLSLVSQGKLLRALQQGVVERVGGTKTINVDVRVVAATNVNLREEVEAGRFREDLYFRLNVYPIHLPPLRERRDDIPLLLSYFLYHYSQRHGRNLRGFTPRAVRVLLSYHYPGNIRELQNLVERGVIAVEDNGLVDLIHIFRNEEVSFDTLYSLGSDGELTTQPETADVEATAGKTRYLDLLEGRGEDPALTLEMLELRVIEEAVAQAGGNLAKAARTLGLTRAQLAYRLQKAAQVEEQG